MFFLKKKKQREAKNILYGWTSSEFLSENLRYFDTLFHVSGTLQVYFFVHGQKGGPS